MPKRHVITAAVALVLVAAAALVGVRWWQSTQASDLERAAGFAPYDAQRLSWTAWADIRAEVGADDLDELLEGGFDADLTSASALVGSAPVLEEHFGFSPATAEWELFSQAEDGAVVIVQLPDGTDFDAIADHLEDAGFEAPADEDGVWGGGPALLPSIGADLTPELQYVALAPDDGLVLTSDTVDYLEDVVDDLDDTDLPEPVGDVVAASGDPLTAAVYEGEHTCSALAMSQADPSDEAAADQLIAEAGEVSPIAGFAMSVQPGGDVRVVLAFANADQARANADSRAALAAGPAPGQGGDFGDRFEVGSVTADDDLVTMDLQPRDGAFVFSDLSTGPVLFATC